MLGSGRWLLSLVYADDVVLLSWSPAGLQLLLDSMNDFCVGLGLVISPTKTEVVVFNGPGTPSLWHVGSQALPQSPRFMYLGLVFMNRVVCLLLSSDSKWCGVPGPAAEKVQNADV